MKKECPNKGKAFTSKSRFSSVENVNIMVLKVMTLIIIIHCIQNFIPIDLTLGKDVKGKGGCGEGNGSQSKGKAT